MADTTIPQEDSIGKSTTDTVIDPFNATGNEINTTVEDTTDDPTSDANKAIATKQPATMSNDFYQRFLDMKDQADFAADLQSSETYWNNRTDERKKYEAQYGDKAREAFETDYKTKVEPVWRSKLEKETEKVVMNSQYDWLFGDDANISYGEAPTFELANSIFNGSRRIGTMLTDKQVTDREAAVRDKRYMNDKGEFINLDDSEEWFKWSRGEGTQMNHDDPKHRSSNGRKIVGFEYVGFDPEYRGEAYVKAMYDGDKPTGELMSMWDTTNSWLFKSNTKKSPGILKMLPKTAIRTGINLAADMVTGTTSMMGSIATWLDADDDNAFIRAMNNTSTAVKSRKVSTSDYDQAHMFTTSNVLDLAAQVAGQLYLGVGLYKGVNALTKILYAANPILKEAQAAKAIGDMVKYSRKIGEFEMKYGKAARSASLVGMTIATGDDVITQARAAGFNEDEVAGIYVAYFAAMLGANLISQRMITPYFTNKAMAPFMREIVKEAAPLSKYAKTDKAKLTWAKNMVQKMADGIEKLPSIAGHTESGLKWRSIATRGINEAMEEEAEWLGQEVVEHGATVIAKYTHRNDKEVPKFDVMWDDGYWARQLPNIAMSGLGGFLGGASSHYMPGMHHETEESFLIKGDDKERMMRVVMTGGAMEKEFLRQENKMFKSGVEGSHLLSTKVNDKTGEFYKMTDSEAEGTLSHAEAAHRMILNQYMYYKTLYGGAEYAYDDIIKENKSLAEDLQTQRGHILHGEFIALHDQRNKLLKILTPSINLPSPGTKPKVESKGKEAPAKTKVAKPEKELTEPIDQTKVKPGTLTAEPQEEDPKVKAQLAADFTEEVKARAEAIGTLDYGNVKELIGIEKQIDDILSGDATIQHVMRAAAYKSKVGVFIPEEQKKIFEDITNADGSIAKNPYTKFGITLIDHVFSADKMLSEKHTKLHENYIISAKTVGDILNSNFTEQNIKNLANVARSKPSSIAIDRGSTQLKKLFDGVTSILQKNIPEAEMIGVIRDVRSRLKLDPDKPTKAYKEEAQAAIYAYEDEGKFVADTVIENDQLEVFINEHGDILHKLALSTFVDSIIEQGPISILNKYVSMDKKEFIETLYKDLSSKGNLKVMTNTESANSFGEELSNAEGTLKELLSKRETLVSSVPEDSADKVTHERALHDLDNSITMAYGTVRSATSALNNAGGLADAVDYFTLTALEEVTREAEPNTLTKLVTADTDTLKNSRNLVEDYYTIVGNIAPVVPSVQTHGSIYNFLNELSTDGATVSSTLDKIIHETDEYDVVITTEDGKTIREKRPQSRIEALEEMVIGDQANGTAEFRNLAEARSLRDAINIRLGQVQLLFSSYRYLYDLQKYSNKYISKTKSKYDTVPRYISEYIIDFERLNYLAGKGVLSPEEQLDLDELNFRADTLFDLGQNPKSIASRLLYAQERLDDLIDMGEKSLDKNERYKAYKAGIANSYNKLKAALSGTLPERLKDKGLEEPIAKFIGMTDKFTEANEDMLKQAKDAIDDILRALYDLSPEDKIEYAKVSKAKDAGFYLFINGMATDVDKFNTYYMQALDEAMIKNPNALSPTYEQENMLRTVYAYQTDEYKVFENINGSITNMLFVQGGSGTGKTTIIGYALAAAQKYQDAKAKETQKDAYVDIDNNRILISAMEEHQAERLKKRAELTGVNKLEAVYYDKYALFNFLESPSNQASIDKISTIVFDEATFIQGSTGEGETELDILHNLIEKFNAKRLNNPIKFIGLGDENQGGWQENMPTIRTPRTANKSLDYTTLGHNRFMTQAWASDKSVLQTPALEYSFRGICDKIPEISKTLNTIAASAGPMGLIAGTKSTSKIKLPLGVLNNDPVRKRFGGSKIHRNPEQMYRDSAIIKNIEDQLTADQTEGIKDLDKKFSVLIVDNNIKSLEDFKQISPDLYELIKKSPENFILRNIESVQGDEADYVLANLNELFPRLPITIDNATRIRKAAMVIARARLFAAISVNEDINLEQVDNSIVSMLTKETSDDLANTWNKFYRNKLWELKEREPVVAKEPKEENKPNDIQRDIINSNKTEILEIETKLVASEIVAVKDSKGVAEEVHTLQKKLETATAPAKRKVLEEKINELTENVVQTANIFNIENETFVNLDSVVAQKDAWDKKGDAIEQAKHLQFLGFIYGYTNMNIDTNEDIRNKRIQYASDVYGKDKYKDDRGDVTNSAMLLNDNILKAVYKLRQGNKEVVKDYKFFLVSFESQDSKGNVVVYHQIYASDKSGIKVPIALLPLTKFGEGSKIKNFLLDRENVIKNATDNLTKLKTSEAFEVATPTKYFGNSGTIFSDEIVAKINTSLAVSSLSIPINTEITGLGRVALSDETADFKKRKNFPLDREGVGMLFLETKLDNIDTIIEAVTAGAPQRAPIRNENRFYRLVPDAARLKTVRKTFDVLKGTVGEDTKILTKEIVDKIVNITSTDNSMLFSVDKLNHKVMKVGNYFVYTFKGTDNRPISVYSTNGSRFRLLFGFTKDKGSIKPIGPDSQIGQHILTDIDVDKLVGMRKTYPIGILSKVKDSVSNKLGTDIVLDLTNDVDAANDVLGTMHAYNPMEIANYTSDEAKLSMMSKNFIENKATSIEDYKIPLATLKKVLEDQDIQISAPIAWTRLTKGDHQGKTAVLYTHKTGSQYDLTNITVLNDLLSRISTDKATDIEDSTKFNASVYAKYGVGFIMLDSKMTNFTELLAKFENIGKDELNRSSSPIGSYANQRMINFIKEMAIAIHAKPLEDNFTHTRLKSMGIDPTTNDYMVKTKVFDNKAKEELGIYLNKLSVSNPALFEQIKSLMMTTTADEHLGLFRFVTVNEPPRIIKLLDMKRLDEREDYWNSIKDNLTSDELNSVQSLGLNKSRSIGFGDNAALGTVKGNLILDPTTGKPSVRTYGDSITYVPSELLGTTGITAEFHMFNFLKHIQRVAEGSTENAIAITKELDYIMKNFSSEGTLNRGIPFYGRILPANTSLGVGLVDSRDIDLFMTSVKDIREPQLLININNLIDNVNRKPVEIFVPGAIIQPQIDQSDNIKETLKTSIKQFVEDNIFSDKALGTIPKGDLLAVDFDNAIKKLTQYIREQNSLVNNGKNTTILTKKETNQIIKSVEKRMEAQFGKQKPVSPEDDIKIQHVYNNTIGYKVNDGVTSEAEIEAYNLNELKKDVATSDAVELIGLQKFVNTLEVSDKIKTNMTLVIQTKQNELKMSNMTNSQKLGILIANKLGPNSAVVEVLNKVDATGKLDAEDNDNIEELFKWYSMTPDEKQAVPSTQQSKFDTINLTIQTKLDAIAKYYLNLVGYTTKLAEDWNALNKLC